MELSSNSKSELMYIDGFRYDNNPILYLKCKLADFSKTDIKADGTSVKFVRFIQTPIKTSGVI